ncbi:hypothetical protein BWZ22_01565 [Seonamhaeicola sp. S2-3]|uniref:hypothetical protein n=1 Tax=Seonamhaeicola sp. S2-3 TaxID=1936081 RepID=UPI000972B449|nr:hypothetical protein [Seonamhaeicola sp. S2-3]APY10011.1 hypothetical protein BWZ22_01565 [Seonamhaeicola sp. S2-3]
MRLYLYREHIERLNEVSDKGALKIMKDIREEYNLPHTRYISIKAYCDYFMLDREDVWACLEHTKAS